MFVMFQYGFILPRSVLYSLGMKQTSMKLTWLLSHLSENAQISHLKLNIIL